MEETLDNTTLATITLLEARLMRVEHLLYGASAAPPARPADEPVLNLLSDLERRFSALLAHSRVYAELLKIYRAHPSLFQPPAPSSPPTQLSPEAVRATVLSFASSFPSTASALTSVTSDTPVPDPALSAALAALLPRMKGLEAAQLAQEAEVAELRARSERAVRVWYEAGVLRSGERLAGLEGRVERVEKGVRRAEVRRAKAAEEV